MSACNAPVRIRLRNGWLLLSEIVATEAGRRQK